MTSLGLTPPLLLLFVLMVSGVVSQYGWSVNYIPGSICSLKTSTVIMGCSYTYPPGYTVRRLFWTTKWVKKEIEPPELSLDSNYKGRVQLIQGSSTDCSLRLSDAREQDQGTYYFRFLTTTPGGKYQGRDGVKLSVTELRVVMIPNKVLEGVDVTLTCTTTCRLTSTSSFTWHKDSYQFSSGSFSNLLHLKSVSQKDVGSYSCSVYKQSYSSPAVILDVQHPPKRVSLSISPAEIVEGSLVTLTCSSDSNPPAHSYTWYKDGSYIRTENTFSIIRIRSEDSGDYTCRAENEHGYLSSTAVFLNVLYPPKSVSVSISPAEIVEGSLVTLTCSSDSNPPAHSYTWYKDGSYIRTENTFSIIRIRSEDSGDYTCRAENEHGYLSSTAVFLNVLYPPKSVSVSISPAEIVEGSLVTLNCSSDSNPPAHSYTWYKVNERSPVGSGQSSSFTLSSRSKGWFYCEARNQVGSQRSAAVPLTLNGSRGVLLYIILGITSGCGCLIGIFCVLYIRRKRRSNLPDDLISRQGNTYKSATTNQKPPQPVVNQDDVLYASIQHGTAGGCPIHPSCSTAAEEVQYATVVKKTQEDDDQYANIRFNHRAAAYRSAANASDMSEIYYS